MKLCTECLTKKPLGDFYVNHCSKDGRTARCKECLYTRSLPTHDEILAQGEKLCSICKESKPLHYFSRDKVRDWFSSACRACIYRQRNERLDAATLQMRIKEIEWRIDMKTRGLCTRCGKRPLSTGTSCQECSEKRTQNKITEGTRRRLTGLCASCGKAPRTYRSLCGRCNKIMQARKQKQYRELRVQVLDHFGNKCGCCGESHRAFLNVDHINGDGRLERSRHDLCKMYRQVLAGLRPDIRLLCWNCNLGRERNGGICPHQQQ